MTELTLLLKEIRSLHLAATLKCNPLLGSTSRMIFLSLVFLFNWLKSDKLLAFSTFLDVEILR